VGHADVGLTTLPTVRADTFEIALDRSALPGGAAPTIDSLRLALAGGDDRLPDAGEAVGYALSDADVSVEVPTLDRPDAAAVRLLSYNAVNNFDRELNSLFIDDRQPSYRRILGAIGPDVVGIQEVYDQTAARTEAVAEDTLGLPDAWNWAKEGQDLVLGSRFPILDTHSIPGYADYESGAFLLDTRDALGTRLVVVNMHPPCCNYPAEDGEPSRNAQRQRVVDGVAAFMRDVTAGKGPFDVAAETPVVVLGDMNFVGDAQQERTLRAGRIVNTDRFGEPAAPDWDGTELLDARPRHTARPLHVTWVDPGSSFPPGRLDYAYVTDSVLEIAHEFVLSTSTMPAAALDRAGLEAGDTPSASDHLPVVIDVRRK
jgi:endonuclease/exonuclease/phosphatase family metal-dependent hydrolase